MIGGWIVKLVLGIALAGFLVIEVGAPLIVRAQADDAAHQVADTAARRFFDTRSLEQARAAAQEEAVAEDVELTSFGLAAGGDVQVQVRKEARSVLLKRFDLTRPWTVVETSASATPRQSL